MGHLVGRVANVGHIDQLCCLGGGGGEREQGCFEEGAEQAPSVGIEPHFSTSNGTVRQGGDLVSLLSNQRNS